MRYFSICFFKTEVCTNVGVGLQEWCERWYYCKPKQVRRFSRIITLVEALSVEEAVEIRQNTHPDLFRGWRHEVREMSSAEEWGGPPDCSFIFPPSAKIIEFEECGKLNLDYHPVALHAFEQNRRWSSGSIRWQDA